MTRTKQSNRQRNIVINYMEKLKKDPLKIPFIIYDDINKQLTVEKFIKLLRIASSKRGLKILLGSLGVNYLLNRIPVVKDYLKLLWANLNDGFLKSAIGKLFTYLNTINSSIDKFLSTITKFFSNILEKIKQTTVKTKEGLMKFLGIKEVSDEQIIKASK